MRFVSKHGGLKIKAKPRLEEPLPTGGTKILDPGYMAEFKPTDVTDWERDAARRHFEFRGTQIEADALVPLDPVEYRISTFDTSNIPDPVLRQEVEEALMRSGLYGNAFIRVEKPRMSPPWPTYETTHHKSIANTVRDLGLDVESVIAYERQERNRPGVIDDLAALLAPEDDTEADAVQVEA